MTVRGKQVEKGIAVLRIRAVCGWVGGVTGEIPLPRPDPDLLERFVWNAWFYFGLDGSGGGETGGRGKICWKRITSK